MTEYSIDDVDFSIAHDFPPDGPPVDVRDDVVWLPDGLAFEIALPDREPVVAGVCLRYLVQWYGYLSTAQSGALSHANGHWFVTCDDDSVTLDLSERVRESNGRDRVVESGPRIVGSRSEMLAVVESVLDTVFDVLERNRVAVDDVVADLASNVDSVDRELLSKWDPDSAPDGAL